MPKPPTYVKLQHMFFIVSDFGFVSGELLSRNSGVHRSGTPAGLCAGLPAAGAAAGWCPAQTGSSGHAGTNHHGADFARSQPAGLESTATQPLCQHVPGTAFVCPTALARAQLHHWTDGHCVDHLLAGPKNACKPTHTLNPRLLFALSWRLRTRFIFHSRNQDRIKFGDIFIHSAFFICYALKRILND